MENKQPSTPKIEIIDFREHENLQSRLGWGLIRLICSNDEELWDKNKNAQGGTDPFLRVSCQINGVDVSIKHVIDGLVEDFDHQLKIAAAGMMKERFQKFSVMMQSMEDTVRREFPELEWDNEDRDV